MTVFDLLFIAIVLGTVVVWITAAVLAMRRHGSAALRLLVGWGSFMAIYIVVVIAVSLLSPRRVLAPGEQQCFDDWCIAINGVDEQVNGASTTCVVSLLISSRAKRASQRENGVSVVLVDDQGRTFDPRHDPNDAPFNALLYPGESATVRRTFDLPSDAKGLSLIVRHRGGPGIIIIGEQASLFHKPTLMRFR
jgi:hypothetical protein